MNCKKTLLFLMMIGYSHNIYLKEPMDLNKMSVEQSTIEYYDNHAEEWLQARGGMVKQSFWMDEIDIFHGLLSHGKILEIGSGIGKEAKALDEKGYEYVGIDPSEGLLTIARRNNPMLTFLQHDCFDMNFPENSFDGFWCAATLLHLPKSKIDSALSAIKQVIKHDGIGFISLKKGIGEIVDEKTNRFFALYELAEMTEILQRHDFIIEKSYECTGKIAVKKDTEWLCFFVRVKKQ